MATIRMGRVHYMPIARCHFNFRVIGIPPFKNRQQRTNFNAVTLRARDVLNRNIHQDCHLPDNNKVKKRKLVRHRHNTTRLVSNHERPTEHMPHRLKVPVTTPSTPNSHNRLHRKRIRNRSRLINERTTNGGPTSPPENYIGTNTRHLVLLTRDNRLDYRLLLSVPKARNFIGGRNMPLHRNHLLNNVGFLRRTMINHRRLTSVPGTIVLMNDVMRLFPNGHKWNRAKKRGRQNNNINVIRRGKKGRVNSIRVTNHMRRVTFPFPMNSAPPIPFLLRRDGTLAKLRNDRQHLLRREKHVRQREVKNMTNDPLRQRLGLTILLTNVITVFMRSAILIHLNNRRHHNNDKEQCNDNNKEQHQHDQCIDNATNRRPARRRARRHGARSFRAAPRRKC